MAGVFLLDCPHCPSVNSAYTIVWAQLRGAGAWDVAATCGGCRGTVVAELSGPNTNPHANISGIVTGPAGFAIKNYWPHRAIPAAPPFTPEAPSKRFVDGEFSMQNGRYNSAVGMYRACLDLATKALQAEGDTFYRRLQWLHEQGRVTTDIREWADHVRLDGNGALHDEDDVSKEDAEALRHFTTMFLRYVFEMPGLVGLYRAAK